MTTTTVALKQFIAMSRITPSFDRRHLDSKVILARHSYDVPSTSSTRQYFTRYQHPYTVTSTISTKMFLHPSCETKNDAVPFSTVPYRTSTETNHLDEASTRERLIRRRSIYLNLPPPCDNTTPFARAIPLGSDASSTSKRIFRRKRPRLPSKTKIITFFYAVFLV